MFFLLCTATAGMANPIRAMWFVLLGLLGHTIS